MKIIRGIVWIFVIGSIITVIIGAYKIANASINKSTSEGSPAKSEPLLGGMATPSPTVDVAPTLQAAMTAVRNAEATANMAQAEVKRQENIALEIKATEEQAKRDHERGLLALKNENLELANENLRLANEKKQKENDEIALQNQQIELENQGMEIQSEREKNFGFFVFLALLVVCIVGFIAWYRKAPRKPEYQTQTVSQAPQRHGEQIAQALSRLPTQTQVSRISPGSIEVRLEDWGGLITRGQLLALARGVLVEKRTLAIANWYGTDDETRKSLPFTRSEFETFLAEFVNRGYAIKVHGHAVLLDQGRDYLHQAIEQLEADYDPFAEEAA